MTNLVIPAAGLGSRLLNKTKSIPKIMVEINGLTIFEHQLASMEKIRKLKDIHFIVGYKKGILISYLNSLRLKYNLHFYYNENFRSTSCSDSLIIALKKIKTGFIYLNSDLIVSSQTFTKLFDIKDENLIFLRSLNNKKETSMQKVNELNNTVLNMDLKLNTNYNAEAVGPVKFSNNARKDIIKIYNNFRMKQKKMMPCYSLFGHFAKINTLNCRYISDKDWVEINTLQDYKMAGDKLLSNRNMK